MNKFHILLVATVVLPLAFVLPSVDAQSHPGWILDIATWYADGKITDNEFTQVLQHLIDEKVLVVPQQIIIKEVQAEVQEDSHVELWEVTNQLRSELDVMTREFASWQKNFHDQPMLDEMGNYKDAQTEIGHRIGDLEIKFNCYVTKSCNGYQSDEATQIDWQKKFNELEERYVQLGERVLELEKAEIERHDREVRSGEVQQ